MKHKIIVADDSRTIQKVVNITLANDPVDLIECLDEKSLFHALSEDDIRLVLLDINLSSNKKGYELAKNISEEYPNTMIMALLGTFDTIDEEEMKNSSIGDKVVKPFESKEFISKVRSLLEMNTPKRSDEDDEIDFDEGDEWVLDVPSSDQKVTSEVKEKETKPPNNHLHDEIGSWGINVPGIIGEEKRGDVELPPIIEEKATMHSKEKVQTPDEVEFSFDDVIEEDETNLNLGNDYQDNIEINISDEIKNEDFWAIDDEEEEDFPEKLEKNTTLLQDDLEEGFSFQELDKTSINSNNFSLMESEIKEKITPIIEDLVKKYCENIVQQVAWEVIPDLAENLIKKELKEISQSIE